MGKIDKEIKAEKEALKEELNKKLFELFDAGYNNEQINRIVINGLCNRISMAEEMMENLKAN